jgi:gas vesicle protein
MRLRNEHESSSNGMFLLGAVAGALVGAGVALLLAPKAGAETRQDLNEGWGSLRDAAARRYREMADRAGVQLDNIEEKADRLADQLENSAREAVESAASRLNTVAARATTTIREVAGSGPADNRHS